MIRKEFYHDLSHLGGNYLPILRNAVKTFREKQAAQASAGLAFYTLFSIFPLLLVFVAGGSYFLDREDVFAMVTQFVQQALPISKQAINENLYEILEKRGTAGILSIFALLWVASGMFTSLAYNINIAWPQASRRNFLQSRLVGLWMIFGLLALIVFSLILSWITKRLPFLDLGTDSPSSLILLRLLSAFGSWLIIFLVFLTLYQWIPTRRVKWRAAVWGALVASLAWKAAAAGFTWFLESNLGQYQLIYGSLGAIVAFLFLIYIISLITLFGAHLSAAIEGWEKDKTNAVAT